MTIHLDCAATLKLNSGAMKMKIIRSVGEEVVVRLSPHGAAREGLPRKNTRCCKEPPILDLFRAMTKDKQPAYKTDSGGLVLSPMAESILS
jgi:hypothetical protein